MNSWVFWEFTNWSWRLLHNYLQGFWNGQLSTQASLGRNVMYHKVATLFLIGLQPFLKVFGFTFSLLRLWYIDLEMPRLTFLLCFFLFCFTLSFDWTAGPMGGDDRDMGESQSPCLMAVGQYVWCKVTRQLIVNDTCVFQDVQTSRTTLRTAQSTSQG